MSAKRLDSKLELLLLALFVSSFFVHHIYFQIDNKYAITNHQVDLYRDSSEDLILLPGVGPQTAAKIIALRKTIFSSRLLLKAAGVHSLQIKKILEQKLIKEPSA